MSFKVEHEYKGITTRPDNFVFPTLLQGPTTKSNQWEPVVVNIIDEIDTDTAVMVASQLRKAEESGQDFVPFFIDSVGGSVYGLLSIIESMRRCKVPIYTFTSGLAASCAACIFSAGVRRFMTKYARLLIHDVSVDFSSETSMTSTNIKVEANEMRILNKTIFRIIAENTGHPIDFFVDLIKTKRNNDVYVSAAQALKWNLATDIGYPVVKIVHTTTMSLDVMPAKVSKVVCGKRKNPDEEQQPSKEDGKKEQEQEQEQEDNEEEEEEEEDDEEEEEEEEEDDEEDGNEEETEAFVKKENQVSRAKNPNKNTPAPYKPCVRARRRG